MKHLLLLFTFCAVMGMNAQEKPDPYTAVTTFFKAFHAKDSLALQRTFHPKARLLRSGVRQGQPVIQENEVMGFIRAVANRHEKPIWKEVLGKPIIHQNQNLATVWVPFRFYLGTQLSHCGVNAFSLSWNGQRWQILSLTDTATKACGEEAAGR